ncbi:hypothetical protein [Phascolarctobacterium sp.]
MQLTSLEYQILEFVSQKGIIRKSEIIKHFETASDIEICIMRLTLPAPNIYNLPPDKTRYLNVIHENSLSNDVKNDYKLKLTSLGLLTLNDYQYNLQISEKNKQQEYRKHIRDSFIITVVASVLSAVIVKFLL